MPDSTIRLIDRALSELGFGLDELDNLHPSYLRYSKEDMRVTVKSWGSVYRIEDDCRPSYESVDSEEQRRRSGELDKIEKQLQEYPINLKRVKNPTRNEDTDLQRRIVESFGKPKNDFLWDFLDVRK